MQHRHTVWCEPCPGSCLLLFWEPGRNGGQRPEAVSGREGSSSLGPVYLGGGAVPGQPLVLLSALGHPSGRFGEAKELFTVTEESEATGGSVCTCLQLIN